MSNSADFKKKREQMVKRQLKNRGIKHKEVLEAFRSVPRHKFVNEDQRNKAYGDYPLPIGQGQTISQPYIVALMIEALEPEAGDIMLEIGTGSGYAAAVLSRTVERVYGLERVQELAVRGQKNCDELGYTNVFISVGDGTKGWPDKAPFDGILVSAAAPEVPDVLLEQLALGGSLVIPVGSRYSQELLKIKRSNQGFEREKLGGVRFVALVGEQGWSSE